MRQRSATRCKRSQVTLGIVTLMVLASAITSCGDSRHGKDAQSAGVPADAWPHANADRANSRNVGGSIDAGSVARLRRAWSAPIAATGYATTPVVAGGVVYTQDLDSNVHAYDLHSGRVLWTKDYNDTNVGPNGVTVARGRVFGATNSSTFALDAKSGRELWSTPLVRSGAEAIDMAPGYSDDTVYVSTALRSAGAVGILWALDARDGHRRWQWAQVPPTLWGHPEVNAGGGLWHPPAFDENGALYIGIGNPLPFPGTPEAPWGSSRPGANRWDNSLVKLDARTGRFRWGRQVLPHDIYDWDLECPPILVHVGRRLVVLASGKLGIVYAFEADRGKLLWRRPVGIHNGHDHDNLLALRGQYAHLKLPAKIYPGDWGGVQTQMASDGHTVYVPVNDLYVVYSKQEIGQQQSLTKGTGAVAALDVATGRVRWVRKLSHSVYGAATVANDVVFTTTFDGTVWGLDSHDGRVLWKAKLPAGTDAPVAIAGDTLITAGSLAQTPAQHPEIVAYRLTRGAR